MSGALLQIGKLENTKDAMFKNIYRELPTASGKLFPKTQEVSFTRDHTLRIMDHTPVLPKPDDYGGAVGQPQMGQNWWQCCKALMPSISKRFSFRLLGLSLCVSPYRSFGASLCADMPRCCQIPNVSKCIRHLQQLRVRYQGHWIVWWAGQSR